MHWLPLMLAALLVLACLPVFLRQALPPVPPDDDPESPACVVVLGAGRKQLGSKLRLSARSLMRLRAALALAQQHKLPLLVSGGCAQGLDGASEAELMARLALKSAPELVIWREINSRNTHENAQYCAKELVGRSILRVYLVTDCAHLCRASLCFRRQGISVRAHATHALPQPDWLPHAGALGLWPELLYEWAALTWYGLRRWL